MRGGVLMPRDYQKEYQKAKGKYNRVVLSTTVTKEIAEDFKAKCSLDEISVNAFLKSCIDAYLDNSLVYENGKLRMN